MSIQAYCSRNNVPYMVLDKWIRDIYKRVVPVQVTGSPDDVRIESHKGQDTVTEKPKIKDEHVIITVKIITNSGMEVSRSGLDYRSLRTFIERLEGLLC